MPDVLEFFAGGGMARAGLGASWRTLLANDIDKTKASVYIANWGNKNFILRDVAKLTPTDVPGHADLSWASFPCQDLSLAGGGGGLDAKRSGTFWSYWRLMQLLAEEGRAPSVIALENVYGALRSHKGKDFVAIIEAFASLGYRVGALLIDAVHFVPQSRLRLFIVGIKDDVFVPSGLVSDKPSHPWHPKGLTESYSLLGAEEKAAWIWWNLPKPPERTTDLGDLIEPEPTGVAWNSADKTEYILSLMAETHLAKVEKARQEGGRQVGTVYRRMRSDGAGGRVQRAEVRFDGISGCLRTPTGGSSKQTVLIIEDDQIRSRLLSPREAARLMGLPDSYVLPDSYNAAYHLAGDGVVAPVVRHLSQHIFEPLLMANQFRREEVAA